MKKDIIYIANNTFPNNTAYATRVLYFCKMFQHLNYRVTVISQEGDKSLYEYIRAQKIELIHFAPITSGIKANFKNTFYSHRKLEELLLKYLDKRKPEVVVLGSGFSHLFLPVKRILNKYNIPLVVEIGEWYDAKQLALGPVGPFYWDNRIAMHYLYKKSDGIIAISEYLSKYYRNCGTKTIRIPTILDIEKYNKEYKNLSEKIIITYAGFPAKKKDYIDKVIIAIAEDSYLRSSIKLQIIGPNREHIEKLLGKKKYLLQNSDDFIEILGKVNQEDVSKFVTNSNFTILLRPNKRYANAGFPTKVAESLACGTPVISNLTSDIGMYVKNEKSGVIIEKCSVESVKRTLKQIIDEQLDKNLAMRSLSKKIAKESFDYRNYTNSMKAFIEEITYLRKTK